MKPVSQLIKKQAGTLWHLRPQDTVFEALGVLAEHEVGALVVMDGQRLVGVMSERDYTRKVALKGRSSKDTRVREILSGRVVSVTPDHTVDQCLRLMTENRVRHLPVLEGQQILGVISIGDLVNWVISAQNATIHQLETYITGFPTPPS